MKKLFSFILVSALLLTLEIRAEETAKYKTAQYKGLIKKFTDRYNEMKEEAKKAITEDNFAEARNHLKKATLSHEVIKMMKEEK